MLWIGEAARLALALLEAAGYEAFVVGGCVRDALRGEPPLDYDLTTNATPEEMKQVFSAHRVIETGLRHGTLTVLLHEEALEITTYRSEGTYSDGRRPDQVTFCASLEEDLSRRDFTINAMAAHPQKGILDPFGGQADLRAGLIRCVGDPDLRLREDALRIVRALRFAAVLGFTLEDATETALIRNRGGLSRISMERIRGELDRMLCGRHLAVVLLRYAPVLHEMLPDLWPPLEQGRIAQMAAAMELAPPDALLRWVLLLHAWQGVADDPHMDQGQGINDRLRTLRFARAQRVRAYLMLEAFSWPLSPEPRHVRRTLGKLGKEDFCALLALRRADALGRQQLEEAAAVDEVEAALFRLPIQDLCLTRRDLALDGRDLEALGYHGQEIGRLLQQLLDAVLDGAVENQADRLRDLLQSGRMGEKDR